MEKTAAAHARSAYPRHRCAFRIRNKPDGAPLPFTEVDVHLAATSRPALSVTEVFKKVPLA